MKPAGRVHGSKGMDEGGIGDGAESGQRQLPPAADIKATKAYDQVVPRAVVSRCSNNYSITSSASASQLIRHCQPERLGRREIDDQIELGRLLDRNFARLYPSAESCPEIPPMNCLGLACRLSRRLQPSP